MRIYPEKLASQLQQQLLPVYLVSGDEPLQVQECCDLIRQQARTAGCTDRELFDASATGFNWHDILHSASSMSLFSERKLLELRVPNGKPGAEGSKALCEYLEVRGEDDVLLIIAGKIDKQSTNSKWFKALDKAGATLQIWPVDAQKLPGWLRQRLRGAGLGIDEDALQLLCEQVEGNLLAAVQEVEKLKLLATDGQITVRTVTAAVADNARYNLFDMTDSALKGDAANSLRMIHGLRAEGSEPLVVLWALSREIRTLNEVKGDVQGGQSVQQALNARRVWNNRMPLMQAALARHDRASLARLVELAARADAQAKGFASGKPWDTLEDLIIGICGLTEPA
jgi:DNA polymerase-3 subunit delta